MSLEPPQLTVYVDIVGDLFHYGHIRFLRSARAMGDRLIVGVCGDEFCTTYKRPPILNAAERAETIAGCRYVDQVVVDCPCPITREFIVEHDIGLVVHGDDLAPPALRHWYGAAMDLGIFATVPYTEGISTSEIIDRINAAPMAPG